MDFRADAPLPLRSPRLATAAMVAEAHTLLAPPPPVTVVDKVVRVHLVPPDAIALPNLPAPQDSEVVTVVEDTHLLKVDSPATVVSLQDSVVVLPSPQMLISDTLMPALLVKLVLTSQLRSLIRTHTISRKRPARTVLLSTRIVMVIKPQTSTRIRSTILMRPLISVTRTSTTSELLLEKTWTRCMTAMKLRMLVLLLVSTRIEDTTLMRPSTKVPLVAFTSPSSVSPLLAMDSTTVEVALAVTDTEAKDLVAQDTHIAILIPITVLDPVRSRSLQTLRLVKRSSSRTSLRSQLISKSAVRPKFRFLSRTTLTSSTLVISKSLVS